MSAVVDFHVHVFEDNLSKWLSKISLGPLSDVFSPDRVGHLRRQARNWMKPLAGSFHSLQTTLRYFPEGARNSLDEISALIPLPSLFVEGTASDLIEVMDEAGVQYAVAIAHPNLIPNEFIIELSQENPRIIPIVNIPKNTPRPGNVLKNYAAKGAKGLKIHGAADGEGPNSPRYRSLVKAAASLGMPVIIHTGCIHSHLFYKNPEYGRAEAYTEWFETYPDTQFILAHMNFHDPHVAMDICEEFPNVYVDTSWQPAEIIGEAVRRIGAHKVLFGSDWPLVGNNINVGLKRIRDCVDIGLLNEEQSKLILGENAVKLLGLSTDDTTVK